MSSELTAERLRKLLSYDPETGEFRWLITPSSYQIGAGEVAGTSNDRNYRRIQIDSRLYRAHRLAWLYTYGCWPSGQIDHINRDGSDNRISNLRIATAAENQHNCVARRGNSSGLKGAHWHSRSLRWQAKIKANNIEWYLGYFDTPEEAHAAYCKAAAELHGEFARAK